MKNRIIALVAVFVLTLALSACCCCMKGKKQCPMMGEKAPVAETTK